MNERGFPGATSGPRSKAFSPRPAVRFIGPASAGRFRRMRVVTADLQPRPASASHATLTQMMEVTDANVPATSTAAWSCAWPIPRPDSPRSARRRLVRDRERRRAHLPRACARRGRAYPRASVNDVGRRSLECGVRVDAENPLTGARVHAATAYFVFVALDGDGQPRPVPPIEVTTEVERRRQRAAKLRREARLQHAEAIRAERDAAGAT